MFMLEGSVNDDGPKYIDFIRNAKVKHYPSVGIGAVVTSRLEKYRQVTAEWLDKNSIKYQQLVMLDLPTGEERLRLRAHAKFKADVYNTYGGLLFVESEKWQADAIFQITGRPVYCYTDGTFRT